jgi:Protein of unknown function (DUF3627)
VGCILDDLKTSYYKNRLEAEQAQREAAENLLNIKQFALEALQHNHETIVNNKNNIIDMKNELIEAAEREKNVVKAVVQDKEETIKIKDKIHQVWSGSHAIIMMRTNNPTSKMPYYAIRRKQKTMSRVIKKFRVKYPCSLMVYQNLHVPNPINMYNRLKRSPIIKFKGNFCNCTAGEAALIEELKRVFTIIEQ